MLGPYLIFFIVIGLHFICVQYEKSSHQKYEKSFIINNIFFVGLNWPMGPIFIYIFLYRPIYFIHIGLHVYL